MKSSLNVLFLAAEAEPFVKIGGLGDVAGSLPPALRRLSIDIRLVLPLHGSIRRQELILERVCDFSITYEDTQAPVEVFSIEISGVLVYFIAGSFIPIDDPVYSQDNLKDGLKYTFFSLAALQLSYELDWPVDILHANDWHTALAVYALTIRKQNESFFQRTFSILCVHNLPYLGNGAGPALEPFGLPSSKDPRLPIWARNLPLPLGLLTADRIVAVSPTYAKEILTLQYGSGLHDFLKTRADSITGILNGLDTQRWDPSNDPMLTKSYDATKIDLRTYNRKTLCTETNLDPDPHIMLMGMVNRMDFQKGVDLVPQALFRLPLLLREPVSPWQLVVLGTGDPKIEHEIHRLELDFPGRVRVITRFDARLSRLIYGGADLILIPSRYEPCGLTQMIAMRYGCVPLARATGGLTDTINDYNKSKDSTGFLFDEPSPEALMGALIRAMRVFKHSQDWRSLQVRGMAQDFSWDRSAREYAKLYNSMLNSTGFQS
jgi:starch synthase